MLLDMDTELQHLISISMEKMTSGATSSIAGHGDRNSGKMDLRKALLVAHFVQEVRQAYCEENYDIVARTFANLESQDNSEENMICDEYCDSKVEKKYMKESGGGYYLNIELPSFPTTSTSAYPSCVTNTDVMVSRISQLTRPLSVSINTDYVVCCQNLAERVTKNGNSEDCSNILNDADVPVFCDELEVSSCCEVMSDDDTLDPEADSQDHVTVEDRVTYGQANVQTSELRTNCVDKKELTLCPLPKKKRPLPKEFLNDSEPSSKAVKVNANSETLQNGRSFDGLDIRNTVTTSLADTVTMKSKISCFSSTISSVSNACPKFRPNPKVVVQLTQSCDSYLPITCSQLYLENRLNGFSAPSI